MFPILADSLDRKPQASDKVLNRRSLSERDINDICKPIDHFISSDPIIHYNALDDAHSKLLNKICNDGIVLIIVENLRVPYKCLLSYARSFRDPPPTNPFSVYFNHWLNDCIQIINQVENDDLSSVYKLLSLVILMSCGLAE